MDIFIASLSLTLTYSFPSVLFLYPSENIRIPDGYKREHSEEIGYTGICSWKRRCYGVFTVEFEQVLTHSVCSTEWCIKCFVKWMKLYFSILTLINFPGGMILFYTDRYINIIRRGNHSTSSYHQTVFKTKIYFLKKLRNLILRIILLWPLFCFVYIFNNFFLKTRFSYLCAFCVFCFESNVLKVLYLIMVTG